MAGTKKGVRKGEWEWEVWNYGLCLCEFGGI